MMELHQDPAVVAAEDLKNALAAANVADPRPFVPTITSIARGYLPKSELASVLPAGIHITVMPGLDGDAMPLNRSVKTATFWLAIVVECKPETMSTAAIDELTGLVEDIERQLWMIQLPGGASHTGLVKLVPRYSWRHMKGSNTFVGIRRFEFKVDLKTRL